LLEEIPRMASRRPPSSDSSSSGSSTPKPQVLKTVPKTAASKTTEPKAVASKAGEPKAAPSKAAAAVGPKTAASKPAAAAAKTTAPKSGATQAHSVAMPEPVTVPPDVTMEAMPPSQARAKRSAIGRPAVTPDVRRGMIAEGAYLRAEKRGFAPGHEHEDWMAAEAEVDQLLSADQRTPQ
jgi:hypothetical protein